MHLFRLVKNWTDAINFALEKKLLFVRTIGNDINVVRHTACFVVNRIIINNFAIHYH